jgi:hypothetical protein
MKFTDDGKAAIVAAVLQSPVFLEMIKQHPPERWDQPAEVARATADVAKAIIAQAESSIP